MLKLEDGDHETFEEKLEDADGTLVCCSVSRQRDFICENPTEQTHIRPEVSPH